MYSEKKYKRHSVCGTSIVKKRSNEFNVFYGCVYTFRRQYLLKCQLYFNNLLSDRIFLSQLQEIFNRDIFILSHSILINCLYTCTWSIIYNTFKDFNQFKTNIRQFSYAKAQWGTKTMFKNRNAFSYIYIWTFLDGIYLHVVYI